MREMLSIDLFSHKLGSRERGHAWDLVAATLNLLDGFAVNQKSVREHFKTISTTYTTQTNKELRKSGEGGEPLSEYDQLIESLIDSQKESNEKFKNLSDNQIAIEIQEKEKGIDIRKQAMERCGQSKKRKSEEGIDSIAGADKNKTRRTSGDTFDLLRAKMEADLETKKAERELQQQQQAQFALVLQSFNDNMQRQQEQSNQMQQQMLLIMQQEQQLLQYLLQKNEK